MQFRGRVLNSTRGAGILGKGLETRLLGRHLLGGWLILELRTVGNMGSCSRGTCVLVDVAPGNPIPSF